MLTQLKFYLSFVLERVCGAGVGAQGRGCDRAVNKLLKRNKSLVINANVYNHTYVSCKKYTFTVSLQV